MGAEDDEYWRGRFEVLRDRARLDEAESEIKAWATDSYSHHSIAEGTTGTELQSAHEAIADALVEAAPLIRQLADQPDPPNPAPTVTDIVRRVRDALAAGRRHVNLPPGEAVDQGAGAQTDQSAGAVPSPVVEAAGELRADLDAVVPAGADVSQCGRRLLAVHVLKTMFVGDVVNCEQPVELMQVSYNSPNCLDPDRKPGDKLAGPEVARLGAFLKHSWRANDWLWGRMDAAYRLVELLLHPIRLRELNCTDGEVRAAVEDILGRALERTEKDEINEDLEFLHDRNMPVPGGLPATTRIIAERLQLLIAREELHMVGQEIERSKALGAAEPDGGAFRRALSAAAATSDDGRVEADTVPALVRQLTVGKETVGEDLGLRMLNRVALQGTAVAVNVLAGERTGLGVASRLAARLKSPLHALNSVASVTLSGTKLGQAATVFLLAAAGAVVAVRLAGVEVSPGLLVVAELLLAATVLVAMLRSGFLWQAIVLAVAVADVGLAIAGDQVRDVVYTTDPNPAWKAWGLTGDVSVLRIGLPIALALFVSARAFNTWTALRGGVKSPKLRRGLVAPVVAIGAAWTVAAIGPQIGKALVTGQPNDSAPKDWVVDTAEFLNGIELTVVVLLLVLIPLAIGYGFDIAIRRWLRAATAGPRRWLRAAAADIRRSVRAAGANVAPKGSNERLLAEWRRTRTARRVRRLEERRYRLSRKVEECEAQLEKLKPKAGEAPNPPLPAPPPSPAGVTP